MEKIISIHCYNVFVNPADGAFEDILLRVAGMQDDESRNVSIMSVPFRLISASRWGHHVEGAISRIRMFDIPPAQSLSGPRQELDLDDNEGLGEETAFLYVPVLKVLLIQFNRNGVGRSAFEQYFSEIGQLRDPLRLAPILGIANMRRLQNLQSVAEVEIQVAALNNLRAFDDAGYSATQLAKISAEHRAGLLTLKMTMGHGGSSLTVKQVIRTLKEFVGVKAKVAEANVEKEVPDADPVKTLYVRGQLADGSTDEIHLTDWKLADYQKVDVVRRSLGSQSRRDALRRSWNKLKDELTTLQGEA